MGSIILIGMLVGLGIAIREEVRAWKHGKTPEGIREQAREDAGYGV